MSRGAAVSENAVFVPAATDAAFAAILPEIAALPDDETLLVNMDVVRAAAVVLGRASLLRSLREQLADELPRFDLAPFDKLEQYALALIHAHGLHRGAQPPKAQLGQLRSELTAIRDRLHGNAVSLADHGLIDGERLKACKTAVGYRAVAADVLTLVPLFKEYWPHIEGKTPITPALLHEANSRAAQLLTAVGLRERASNAVGEKAQLRAKAFTVFMRAYEETREAVLYLRRKQGDAAQFAPPLRGGPGRPPRRAKRAREQSEGKVAEGTLAKEGNGNASSEPLIVNVDNPESLPIDNPFMSTPGRETAA